jgi:hypothetical protein
VARKAKPPASFSAAKWASLIDAVELAESALGSGYLAEDNLIEHFQSGRVPTAVYRGGVIKLLEPTFWESVRIVQTVHPSGVLVILVVGLADESIVPHLFVARAALNKLYSLGPAPSGAPTEPPGFGPGRPTRHEPGPRPETKPRPATGKRKAGAKGNPWWPDLIRHLNACFPRRPHPDSDVSFNAAKNWLIDNKKALPAESTIRNGLRKRLPTWPRDSRRA